VSPTSPRSRPPLVGGPKVIDPPPASCGQSCYAAPDLERLPNHHRNDSDVQAIRFKHCHAQCLRQFQNGFFRAPSSERTLLTPELDQLPGHARKSWPDGYRRRPPRHARHGQRGQSIAESGDKRCRTANVLRPEIIPHVGRHHAIRRRRYPQLLRRHVVHLRRRLISTHKINTQQSFKETIRRALAV
jgi:hypothetical protein